MAKYMFIAAVVDALINWVYISVLKIDLNSNDRNWRFPNHRYNTIIRLLGLILIYIIFGLRTAVITASLAVFLYWPVFHYLLNILRDMSIDHLGKNPVDKFLSKIDDKVGSKKRIYLHLFISMIITILTIILL